ncbi:MAG: SufD family Fe-S cluster assembly protein [Prevotella sp.]|nr:SufD family Fe-S cluster assembly protein [Prevotella sp.]MCM1075403.1 SufD family Fe-S cluster assembly protein [Ruminococcus sp.]
MNALSQYIDLYESNREAFAEHGAPLLDKYRSAALEALKAAELPRKGSENYEHTDLQAILSPDYGLNVQRLSLGINPADTFSCHVPNMSTSMFFLCGDGFASTPNSGRNLPEGVTVTSLRYIAREKPELIEPYYGKIADLANPLVALNTLLVQDGLVLHVAKGVKVERPVQLVSILQGAVPMMAVRRLLIVLEDDAEACLLCCDHTQDDKLNFLNLQTIEIYAGKGAKFDLYELEESTPKTSRLSTLYLDMEREANVLLDGITLFNGTTRNEIYTRYLDEMGNLQILGMGIEDAQRRLDNFTLVRHDKPHCTSNELFKYVVDGHSVGTFTGRVYVAPGAVKTEAMQANRNLVASPEARMFSKPQLEIYADDVKCSHGTAIGQLDPMQIFYMRTRGLDENTAKTLLRQAFMADVIEPVRLEQLRTRLRHLVDMRLSGDADKGCVACASIDECTENPE